MAAMKRAGVGPRQLPRIIRSWLRTQHFRILALIGNDNAGDALIACGQLLADTAGGVAAILTDATEQMRPLAQRALAQLDGRVETRRVEADATAADMVTFLNASNEAGGYDVCIDGLLGMAFKPPLRQPLGHLIEASTAEYSLVPPLITQRHW